MLRNDPADDITEYRPKPKSGGTLSRLIGLRPAWYSELKTHNHPGLT